jgi:hypothetical protein
MPDQTPADTAPEDAAQAPAEQLPPGAGPTFALAEIAGDPEAFNIEPGSAEHVSLLSKALLTLHARLSLLETDMYNVRGHLEDRAEHIIRL